MARFSRGPVCGGESAKKTGSKRNSGNHAQLASRLSLMSILADGSWGQNKSKKIYAVCKTGARTVFGGLYFNRICGHLRQGGASKPMKMLRPNSPCTLPDRVPRNLFRVYVSRL